MDRLNHILTMREEDPDDPFLKYAESLERIKLMEWGLAEEILDKLINDAPQYLPSYYQLGKLKERKQAYQEAIHVFELGIPIAEKAGNRKTVSELKEAMMLLEGLF